MSAIDRFTVDLDLDPGGLALGNRDLDLGDLVLFRFDRRLGGIGTGRIRRLVGVFVLVSGFGLLGRFLSRRLGSHGCLGRRLGCSRAATTQEYHDEQNQQQHHGTDADVNNARIDRVVLRGAPNAASAIGATTTITLRYAAATAIGTTTIATLALRTPPARTRRKLATALIAALARARHRRALPIGLGLRTEARRHLRGIGVGIAIAGTPGGYSAIATTGVSAVAVTGARIATQPTSGGKRTVIWQGRTAKTISLRTNFLAGARLGDIARLRRALAVPCRTTTLNHQKTTVIDRRTRVNVAGSILKTTALLRGIAFICHEVVKISVDDLARVKPQKASVARNHALRIATRGHRCKVTSLEKLDDLRPDFDGVGDLLDGKAHPATLLEQHVTKACSHQNPPNSRSSRTISASTDSSAASPSSSSRTSRGLEPSGGPTTPFSSSMSIIRPARA